MVTTLIEMLGVEVPIHVVLSTWKKSLSINDLTGCGRLKTYHETVEGKYQVHSFTKCWIV